MDSRAQKAAIHTMDDLMSHPITFKFHNPGPQDNSEQNCNSVKNPIDLSTIKMKIQNGSYKQVQEWLDDVELVWSNAETLYHDNVHTAVVNECRNVFEIILKNSGLCQFNSWCEDVFRLEKSFQQKIQDAPQKVRQSMGGQKQKRRENKFSDAELAEVGEMYEMLTPDEKINVSIMLAETEEFPGVGYEDMWINLESLRTGLVERLKKHIAGLLQKRGIKFSGDEDDESSDGGDAYTGDADGDDSD